MQCVADIRPQTAQSYDECKSTVPSLVTWQIAVYKHFVVCDLWPTYGHKLHDFITNVNQRFLAQ